MSKRCYYETLDVDRNASSDQLKSAFRKLAMKCHPDRNPDNPEAEQQFKEINEAYDILKDDQRRAAYDQFGHAAFENGGMGQQGGFGQEFGFNSSFADVFDDLFSEFVGGRRSNQRNRGSDMRYNLEITLEEAHNGKAAEIRVPSSVTCDDCTGTGAADGANPITCPTCSGRGKVRSQQGFFTVERTCPTCHGQGRIIQDPCSSCMGTGRLQKERTLSINIPEGVEEGTRIRLAGEGEAGLRGGGAGDLYIFISVAPHDIFQRDGMDLFCRIPISITTAALGGQLEVPVISGGRTRVTIPDGTQSGRQFRLRGKGMPGLRGQGKGDLYVQTMVETPVKLTKKQKELLKEFEASASDNNNPESTGFFSKVRQFWDELSEQKTS